MSWVQRWYRVYPVGLWLAALVVACPAGMVQADQGVQIIDQMEQGLRDDRQQGLDLLSPKAFSEAMKAFEQSKSAFAKKGGEQEFQAKVKVVNEARLRAARNAELVKRTIPEVLKARVDALRANAPEVAAKPFTDGSKSFEGLIERIESGKITDAKKRAPEAETLFRDAELEAIKITTINVARDALIAAEKARAKDYAPLSYSRSDSLIMATDKLLSENRYAGEQAAKMAREAEYQARLSVYLTGLARAAQEDKEARERQFIEISEYVTRVAHELGITPVYDEGYESPITSILTAVRNLKQENLALSNDVASRNQTISRLQQAADSLQQNIKEREAGLRAQVAQTQEQLEAERRALTAKREFEQKIASTEQSFSAAEAAVVQERGSLVIRLYGLSFKSGQSVIEPEYFSLLSKVQRAIREFPGCAITIEGHTDGVGYQELNQKLSEDRALAVREYIIASMGLDPSTVKSVGYGASRPIANNATPEGRAKNRRIDVVITPTAS